MMATLLKNDNICYNSMDNQIIQIPVNLCDCTQMPLELDASISSKVFRLLIRYIGS